MFKDNLKFAEIIQNESLKADKEYVPYNIDKFFCSTPVNKTIDYVMRIN